jgi:hypothetical protein
MAAPIIVHNYPSNGDVDIPVGEALIIYFDRGVDIESAKNSIVLFGADFDTKSGPDGAVWVDGKRHKNPLFLHSPGFKGTVPIDITAEYWDTTDTVDYAVSDEEDILDEADEVSRNIGTKLTIRPKEGTLAPNVEYTLYINGDPDARDETGVSSRTVFDVIPDSGNTNSTGEVRFFGTWAGTSPDVLNIKVTTAGDIGEMKYKWWYDSTGEIGATLQRVASRRYRNIDNDLQVRFTGSDFALNDVYRVNLEPTERLAESVKIVFSTNDATWANAPADPSTPAVSAPPSSVLPGSTEDVLRVIKMVPEHTSYNNRTSNREIRIYFSDYLDDSTISDSTVILWSYPVDGHYGDTREPKELSKELSVENNILTIKF